MWQEAAARPPDRGNLLSCSMASSIGYERHAAQSAASAAGRPLMV